MSADAAGAGARAVVVHAVITPAEGRVADVVSAVAAAVAGIRAEAGCELYAPHVAPDGTIVILEKWTTRADLDVHGTGESIGVLRAGLTGLTAEPAKVTVLEPLLLGTPATGAV